MANINSFYVLLHIIIVARQITDYSLYNNYLILKLVTASNEDPMTTEKKMEFEEA